MRDAKIYHIDDEAVTLLELCEKSPVWATGRIRTLYSILEAMVGAAEFHKDKCAELLCMMAKSAIPEEERRI